MISIKDNIISPPLNITTYNINNLLFSNINYSSKKLKHENGIIDKMNMKDKDEDEDENEDENEDEDEDDNDIEKV